MKIFVFNLLDYLLLIVLHMYGKMVSTMSINITICLVCAGLISLLSLTTQKYSKVSQMFISISPFF
jgi:hypothetical protein